MSTVKDNVQPGEKWAFDADVTAVFDDMLARSIPQYAVMRKACTDLAVRYAMAGTDVVDLGCSRGEALAPLVERLGVGNRYVGVEVSEPMLAAARERFAGEIELGLVRVENVDLRHGFPECCPSVVLSVLTLQFVPIEHRQRVVSRIYDRLAPGGAFILVEKVLGATAALDDTMVATYYDLKKQNGYSQDAIDRKRLSLEGVLVPITADWNEQLLRAAGFSQIDTFWRWFNFAGWIAIKGRD